MHIWRINFLMIVFLASHIWANLCFSSSCTYRDCARDCLDCSLSQSGPHKHYITDGALYSKSNVLDSRTCIRKYFNQMVNMVGGGCTYQIYLRTGSRCPSTDLNKFASVQSHKPLEYQNCWPQGSYIYQALPLAQTFGSSSQPM